MPKPQPDFTVIDCGSIWLIEPGNEPARQHLRQNVSSEALWYYRDLVVEPRYVEDMRSQLYEAGWSVA